MHRATIMKILLLSASVTLAFAGNGEVEKDESKTYNSPRYYDYNPVYNIYPDPLYDQPVHQQFYGSAPPFYVSPPRYQAPIQRLPSVYTPPPRKPLPVAPPPRDAILLCANARCGVGTVCRIVQLCPTCRPLPACVNPRTIPPGTDQACHKFSFRQAVLLGKPPVQVKPLNCIPWLPNIPRGGCNPGTVCVTVAQPGAAWGAGTCCAGKMAPGSIPPAPIMAPVTPSITHVAPAPIMTPVAPTPRVAPGVVPVPQPPPRQAQPLIPAPVVTPPTNPLVAPVPSLLASRAAAVGTPMTQGSTYGQKPGVCPPSVGPCTGSVCSSDLDCNHNMKCCPSACGGRRCSDPSPTHTSQPAQPSMPVW